MTWMADQSLQDEFAQQASLCDNFREQGVCHHERRSKNNINGSFIQVRRSPNWREH
jgi:hypothetical protein